MMLEPKWRSAICQLTASLALVGMPIPTWRKGGPGSGNWGHVGRPGERGGSASAEDSPGGEGEASDEAMREGARVSEPVRAGPGKIGRVKTLAAIIQETAEWPEGAATQIIQQYKLYVGESKSARILASRAPDGKLQGAVIYTASEETGHDVFSHTLYVEVLATSPEYEGRGVGTSLMAAVCRLAVKNDRGIALTADSGAISYYEKLGMSSYSDAGNEFEWSVGEAGDFLEEYDSEHKAASKFNWPEIIALEPANGAFTAPAVESKGGPGSGNWGHEGRPGEQGGSTPSTGGGEIGSRGKAGTLRGMRSTEAARASISAWPRGHAAAKKLALAVVKHMEEDMSHGLPGQDRFAKIAANKPEQALILEGEDGQVLGVVDATLVAGTRDPITGEHEVHWMDGLEINYLASSGAVRGTGTELMAHIAARARDYGVKVWTEPITAAVPFYEKLGMHMETEAGGRYPRMEWTAEEAKAFADEYFAEKKALSLEELYDLEPEDGAFTGEPLDDEEKGGPGSGNFGHEGRPGEQGGSAPNSGGGASGGAVTEGEAGRRAVSVPPEGMNSYYPDLMGDLMKEDASTVKKYTVGRLWEGLQGNPEFVAFAGAYTSRGGESAVSDLVARWATTSGDSDPLAISIQVAAVEEFGLAEYSRVGADTEIPHLQPALRAFVRAQYEETQAYLKAQGVDYVDVVRGVAVPPGSDLPNGITEQEMMLQPLSSFSTNPVTSEYFAYSSSGRIPSAKMGIIHARVPRERIFTIARTGVGCKNESEVVVLGSDKPDKVRVGVAKRSRGLGGKDSIISKMGWTN